MAGEQKHMEKRDGRETEKGTTVGGGPRVLALADSDGIARVFPVSMEQVKAAFEAIGSAPLEGLGQKRIVFYVGEGQTESDLIGAIGEAAFKVERLAATVGSMVVSLMVEKTDRQEDICDTMHTVVDVMRDEAKELDILLSAVRHSMREAREGKQPKIAV